MDNGITKENLLRLLPPPLVKNPAFAALAASTAEALAARLREIDRTRIAPNIDELPETLLDILAYDFKVDWYDPNFDSEQKRRTLKSSWRVHRTLGTKAAVDEAVSAVYPGSRAVPWFEYGGEPYRFRFEINASGSDATLEKQNRVLELAKCYRSLRDKLDNIQYTVEAKAPAVLRFGGTMGVTATVPVPEKTSCPELRSSLHFGGAGPVISSVPVGERREVS